MLRCESDIKKNDGTEIELAIAKETPAPQRSDFGPPLVDAPHHTHACNEGYTGTLNRAD